VEATGKRAELSDQMYGIADKEIAGKKKKNHC
jgi:hypothetical protein